MPLLQPVRTEPVSALVLRAKGEEEPACCRHIVCTTNVGGPEVRSSNTQSTEQLDVGAFNIQLFRISVALNFLVCKVHYASTDPAEPNGRFLRAVINLSARRWGGTLAKPFHTPR